MTEIQRVMLAVCFGGIVGFYIAEIGILVYELASYIRRKHRKRKTEKSENQQNK
nr:MAG TPA: Integrin alpha-IIb, Integrin beta-3, transmembrane signaling, protein structure [Caudoviricetes sp.]